MVTTKQRYPTWVVNPSLLKRRPEMVVAIDSLATYHTAKSTPLSDFSFYGVRYVSGQPKPVNFVHFPIFLEL